MSDAVVMNPPSPTKIFIIQTINKVSEEKLAHCGKRLFFVQKSHFAVEISIDVSDMGRCSLSKELDEFSKNTVTH